MNLPTIDQLGGEPILANLHVSTLPLSAEGALPSCCGSVLLVSLGGGQWNDGSFYQSGEREHMAGSEVLKDGLSLIYGSKADRTDFPLSVFLFPLCPVPKLATHHMGP